MACSAALQAIATPSFAEDATAVLQTVVVTGSRIRSEADQSTGPVMVVDTEQLVRGGNDSLGKVLQSLPYNTGSPVNTNVNNGGDGSTRVSLRGLQPQRTVTLLNGRRLPNGGIGADSSVDIDSLPLSMIDHVEVLTTGASAVYGADAIGGVINVITRSDFTGVEFGGQMSQSDRGDGAVTRAQALAGVDIGRGNWMLGVDYVDQQDVFMSAREYSAVPLVIADADGSKIFLGSPSIPDGRFVVRNGNALGLAPGNYTRVPGAVGQSAADWRIFTAADSFNYAPYNYLQTPNERGSLWLTGTQPLGDDVELFVEGLYSHRESSQKLAPAPYSIVAGAAPVLDNGSSGIPADNYYNPFGIDILRGARRLVELDDRGFSQRVDMWRALAGLRGHLGTWTWEASAAVSESDAVTRENGLPLADRFVAGLGPSGPDANGTIVCGERDPTTGVVPANAIVAGCVPIDLFNGAGTITQEQIEYIEGPLRDTGFNSQRLANIGFEGPWGQLPAGDILWAIGGEFRRDAGAYRYDPQRVGGTVSTGLADDVAGSSFEAREGYAEVRLPLLSGGDGASLTTTLGGRLSDFSSFGTHATWHAGVRWQVSGAWAIRADYSTLFRAPSLEELFQSQGISEADGAYDPCGSSPTPQQQVNCAANGVPGGSYVYDENTVFNVHAGGNQDLAPEEGSSFVGGIEFGSRGASGWRVSADYFRTILDGYIEYFDDPSIILVECADSGNAGACSKITRFDDGTIDTIDLRNSNLGKVSLDGIDLGANAGFSSPAGEFTMHAIVTNLLSYEKQEFEGSQSVDMAGNANLGTALPEWRALGGMAWSQGAWGVSYSMQWIGSYKDCSWTIDDVPYCGHVPDVLYHDVDATWQSRGLTIRGGVNNLTDRDPPFLNGSEANTSTASYRLLGRTYFLQLSYALR